MPQSVRRAKFERLRIGRGDVPGSYTSIGGYERVLQGVHQHLPEEPASTSFGAQVKDLIAPQPVNISNCPPPTTPPPTTMPPATTPAGAPQTGAGGAAHQPFPVVIVVLSGLFAAAAALAALRRRHGA
jgi:hypothetical protein